MNPNQQRYLNEIYPNISETTKQDTLQKYDYVSPLHKKGSYPLPQCNIVMLVGLTGTGKSTTLRALHSLKTLTFTDEIPTRREVANLILIPTAQYLQGEPLRSVKDREERFRYTHYFRENFAAGGTAEAFTWLAYQSRDRLTLSEGVRGKNEIAYALENTRWRIIELWVDPVTRLKRLSNRNDAFDQIAVDALEDLSFLPDDVVGDVREMLSEGEITPEAVATVRAESRNYGGEPYSRDNTTGNYLCLTIDQMNPSDVAEAIADWIDA